MPAVVALPDLVLVLGAVLLMALAFALWALRDFLVNGFSHLPIVGGWVGRTLGGWLEDAGNAVMSGAQSTLLGAVHLFNALAGWVRHVLASTQAVLADALLTAEHIATVQIPRAYKTAVNWAHIFAVDVRNASFAWFQAAVRDADAARAWAAAAVTAAVRQLTALALAEYHSAVSFAQARFAQAEADIGARFAQAEAYARGIVAAAAAVLSADIARAEATASALFRAAESDTAAALRTAEAFATARAAAAADDTWRAVQGAATAGLADVWPGIITDVEQLRGVIAGSWPDIRDAVDAIPRAVPADLAGVISAVGVLAIPMLRFMDECGLPNCRNLGGLGSFLKDLLGAAEGAALLGWLVLCVADPVAAAADTEAAGGPVAAATLGGLERLFGVAV